MTTFGERIASWARRHAPASAHGPDLQRYREAVESRADLGTPWAVAYYERVPPSTCARFVCNALAAAEREAREAGVPGVVIDDVLEAHYHVGAAVSDSLAVAERHRALESYPVGGPSVPFEPGDIVIVDGPPFGIHEIVCLDAARVDGAGRWAVPTAEGGQADGGVGLFVRYFDRRSDGSRWLGGRRVRWVIRASRFRYDDPAPESQSPPTQREGGPCG